MKNVSSIFGSIPCTLKVLLRFFCSYFAFIPPNVKLGWWCWRRCSYFSFYVSHFTPPPINVPSPSLNMKRLWDAKHLAAPVFQIGRPYRFVIYPSSNICQVDRSFSLYVMLIKIGITQMDLDLRRLLLNVNTVCTPLKVYFHGEITRIAIYATWQPGAHAAYFWTMQLFWFGLD